MSEIDWNAEAIRAANHFNGGEHFQAPRGSKTWHTLGVCVVFGNDDYTQDVRAKQEVEFIRATLAMAGIAELGFGVNDDDGYTWAMLTRAHCPDDLNDLAWDAWSVANGSEPSEHGLFRSVQQSMADAQMFDASGELDASISS
jgi:hypothetical protein